MKMPLVLVVAEAENLRVLSSALGVDYTVVSAPNIPDAVAHLADHAPSLVIIDLSTENAAALRAILEADEKGGTPTLLIYAPGEVELPDALLKGATACITRPIEPGPLKLTVRNCITLKEQRDLLAGQEEEFRRALVEQEAKNRLLQEREEQHRAMLQSSQADWECTFNSLPDLIAVVDTTHAITRVNRAMAECCGSTPEALISRKCYEVMHGTDAPVADCPLVKTLADGAVRCVQLHEKLGRVLEVTVSPMRGSGGVTGCVHVARDVTGKVMTEAYDRTGEEILQVLSETGSHQEGLQRVVGLLRAATGADAVGIRLKDGDDFPFFYHDGFSTDLLETENSLLMRSADGICRDDCGNACLECTCGLVISRKGGAHDALLTCGGSFWTNDSSAMLHGTAEEEARTNPRNRCIHKGSASLAVIPIRAKGTIAGVLQLNGYRKGCFTPEGIERLEKVSKGIGEALLRKQAEEKLIASERFVRTITDQLPGVVGYWTSDLLCAFANQAYVGWFGIPPERIIGSSMQEVLGAELFAKNETHISAALRGEAQRFERRHVRADGTVGFGLVHYIPDIVEGAVRGFCVLVSDVTELKWAEEEKVKLEVQLQQAQKMEAIGRLAGGVAHDFNNMLGVIIGRAELALQHTDQSTTHDGLVEIRDAAQRSANLTRQLLAFARKQTILPKVLDLNETISGMLRMLQRLIGEDIHLTWLPDPDLWRVHADPGQIDQVLANLCVNARDAIKNTGRITIRTQNSTLDPQYCREHPDAVPGEYVRLTVTDDGCGMDKETRENIFEPFYTTKELGKGTGLGLATVFGIIKQNSGTISVYSAPEQGTTFSLYLPRFVEKRAEAPAPRREESFPTGDETVLVVEDEPTILAMAAMMLQHQGYHVLKAASPDEAVSVAEGHSGDIHLLLTDVIMPKMNGRDLAMKMLQTNPSLKCLFMSGYSADACGAVGVLEGVGRFMQKPFTLASLAVTVRAALDC